MKKAIVLPLIIVAAANCQQDGSPAGTIQGRVQTERGKPLAHAEISAAEAYGPINHRLRRTQADEHGAFTLSNIAPGVYRVTASKSEEGYGDPEAAVFSAGRPAMPIVTVKPGGVVRDVIIDVGVPGGHLDAVVIDKATGQPLENGRFIIIATDGKKMSLTGSIHEGGKVRTALPLVPFSLQVIVAGYKPWSSGQITPKPNQVLNLTISMER